MIYKLWATFVGLAGAAILMALAYWGIAVLIRDASVAVFVGVICVLAILFYCGNYIERAWRP